MKTLMKVVSLEGMQNYWSLQLVLKGTKRFCEGDCSSFTNLCALSTRKTTFAGYSQLSEGKIISLLLEG